MELPVHRELNTLPLTSNRHVLSSQVAYLQVSSTGDMGASPRFVDLRTRQQMEQQGYGPYSSGEKDVDPVELPDALDIRLVQYSNMAGRVCLYGHWAFVATSAARYFRGPFAYRIGDYCQWYHW